MHPPHRLPRLAAALLAASLLPVLAAGVEAQTLRLGVYHNPPKVLLDESGAPSGIFGDLALALAAAEGWTLTPVPCDWQACLAALERGDIDLMPDVAWSESRDEVLAFHEEPVLHSWSQLYHTPGSALEEVTELAGQRIAVMQGSTQQAYLTRLLASFGVDARLVGTATLEGGFVAVREGRADAVVANHLFGGWQAPSYGLVASPIMFDPVRLHFAAPRGRHAEVLARIDAHLTAWKASHGSPYHRGLARWGGDRPLRAETSSWLGWGLTALLTLLGLTALGNLVLRRRVAAHQGLIRQTQEDNRRLTFYDSLTGLPNRRHLIAQLQQNLDDRELSRANLALVLIDLDRFKRVNDTLSHVEGDRLLYRIANQLERQLSASTPLLAHLGADEFALVIDDLDERRDLAAQRVEQVGERLLSAIVAAQPQEMADLGITGSIGVALLDASITDAETLLQQADIAVSHAKAAGGNQLRFFDAEIQADMTRRVQLEADLRRALGRQELELYYQVQVDEHGTPTGAEALLRWHHPEEGLISPASFIPLAEETGLILPIGHWVLETACRKLAAWAEDPLRRDHALSVNVSPVQFRDPHFVSDLDDLLAATGAPPRRLVLEVTESLLMEAPEQVSQRLALLQAMGVRLALDDFGTGYSSLGYLKQLSLHELKIDKRFVDGIPHDPQDMAIVDTVLTLANRLGLEVTAEGVETDEQYRWLRERGCRRFQGYHFGRPAPLLPAPLLPAPAAPTTDSTTTDSTKGY
jgi:diguanylate cyclase (GGDEF)-like protein